MDPGIDFLQDLAVVMVTAGLTTIIFHKLKQPVVLGYILAGIIIGPNTPPMPLIKHQESIKTLAELGIIFLMFRMGLHFSLRKLFKIGAAAFLAAAFEITLMVFLGYQIGHWFGWTETDSIFLGFMLSISSTTIIVKSLTDLKLINEKWVQLIFAILIGEDLVAVAILAMLPVLASSGVVPLNQVMLVLGELSIFLVVVLVTGLLFIPKILKFISRYKDDEMLLVAVLGIVFGVSLLAVNLGYSVALGAFLVGAIMAETKEAGRIEHVIASLRNMFSAVFFVAIGMLIQPGLLVSHTLTIVIITLAVIFGKIISCSAGALLAGNDTPTAIRVGMGLAQIGEFSFIIAQMGMNLGVISEYIYSIIVTVSAITAFTTPYLIRSSDGIAAYLHHNTPKKASLFLNFYRDSIRKVRDGEFLQDEKRILLRKLALQSVINILLITGIFIMAGWINKKAYLHELVGGGWLHRWVMLAVAIVLSMPVVLGTIRKIQKIGQVLQEKAGAQQFLSGILELTFVIAGIVALALWILILSFAILPEWQTLLLLMILASVFAFLMRKPLLDIYRAGQDTLRQTLTAEIDESDSAVEALGNMLQDTLVERIIIAADSFAAGKLIRELHLRSKSGVTIVGIERAGNSIVNPGPDEEILAEDILLVLGKPAQISGADNYIQKGDS